MKKSFLLMTMFLAACGSGGGASSAINTTQPSVMDAVVAAQASGAIPALDRTTSLLGTDIDGNGVRDDLDAYINSLPDTPVQKKALRQHAAALNAALAVDLTNQAAVDAVSVSTSNAASCNELVYGDAAWKHSKDIFKYIINTKERFVAYMKYNQALSGRVLDFPPKGVGCAP